jgi:hypothetical protein
MSVGEVATNRDLTCRARELADQAPRRRRAAHTVSICLDETTSIRPARKMLAELDDIGQAELHRGHPDPRRPHQPASG